MENQQNVMRQFLDKDPSELYYIYRVSRKLVTTNKTSTFEFRNNCKSAPNFLLVGFQARNTTDSQVHSSATFDTVSFSNAVCKIRSEKYPVDEIE